MGSPKMCPTIYIQSQSQIRNDLYAMYRTDTSRGEHAPFGGIFGPTDGAGYLTIN